MLLAESLASKGNLKAATDEWFKALKVARGRFGERALAGWLKSYTELLGRKSDPLVLARLILSETQEGRVSAYMMEKRLTTDAAIVAKLRALTPEWLTEAEVEPLAETPPPAAKGIPADDPVLTKSAATSCSGKRQQIAAWAAWLASLTEDQRLYWQALVAQCSGQPQVATASFKALYPKLGRQAKTHAFAVEAAGRVATMQRAVGLRTEAADTYTDLMKLWAASGVTPESMGLEPVAHSLRRIDETLWASRYRSLIGDYENAKIYSQDAINLVSNTYAIRSQMTPAAREQLASLRAEAYHTLAYRIAVEKQEFESATSLSLLGLQTAGLNREWTDRLTWFVGLYEYLSGNNESAKKRWEAQLTQVKDESQRAMIYFWLAKVYDRLDRKAESRFYMDAAVEDYPLSFYSTVAPGVASMTGVKDWRDVFGEPRDLERRLVEGRDFGLTKVRKSASMAPDLLRAEILAAANLNDLGRIAVDELDESMSSELLVENNVGPYVYLSRLAFSTGNYLKAISITTKLAKGVQGFWKQWPEQILVYYPRPYREIYERNSLDNTVDIELLLAISRQESGFSPEVRSSVNALGVMQLIRPTAERFAAELGLPTEDIEESLANPDYNIKIGSRYLRFLSLNYKGFPPAVYGGYNAGEYAVDLWLKRRAHSDPLMFVELIPFGETKDYVKNVWRNLTVYRYLESVRDRSHRPMIELMAPPGDRGSEPRGSRVDR